MNVINPFCLHLGFMKCQTWFYSNEKTQILAKVAIASIPKEIGFDWWGVYNNTSHDH